MLVCRIIVQRIPHIASQFQAVMTFSSRTDSAYILTHKGFLCGLAIAYKLVVGMCRGLFMWSGHDICYCLSGLSLSLPSISLSLSLGDGDGQLSLPLYISLSLSLSPSPILWKGRWTATPLFQYCCIAWNDL